MPELPKKPTERREDGGTLRHSAINAALDRAKSKPTNGTGRKSGTPAKKEGS